MRQSMRWMPVLALSLAFLLPGIARAEEAKIAVVDLYKAISETEDGKKAKDQLETYFDKKQKKLDSKSETLKSKMEDLQEKEKVLDKEDYDAEVEALQQEIVELQGTYADYQKQVLEKEQKLTEPILEKLQGILESIGKKEGYAFILRAEAVAWSPSYTDITDMVVQEYNKLPSAFTDGKGKKKSGSTKDSGKKDGTKDSGKKSGETKPKSK